MKIRSATIGPTTIRTARSLVLLVLAGLLLPGCQALREVANLRNVDFAIDRVTGATLAGVDLGRYERYEDVRPADLVRLTTALAVGDLPLDFTLHLAAENPAENTARARLVELDWTLFLNERETVSGLFTETILLPPGEVRDVPITIRLDLLDFFDRNARDLLDLALAVTGQGGRPQEIRLQAIPTIDTPIGPIRYPEPITIVSREVGAQ